MVNFRYHLVSLIAIFVALCIGVILGAGPLQQRLSESLNPQTDAATRDMPAQLSQARADLKFDDSALTALGDRILPHSLDGHKVVLMSMNGTAEQDVKTMRGALEKAGATISAEASLTENWDSEGKREYRKTLSTAISDKIPNVVSATMTPDAVISNAVIQVLTTTGAQRDLLVDILTDATNPILKYDKASKTQGSSLVLVGPRAKPVKATNSGEGTQSKPQKPSVDAWVGIAQAIGAASASGLVLGDASQSNSFIAAIRHGNSAVTSVDSVGTSVATLSAALALPTASPHARALGRGQDVVGIFPSTDAQRSTPASPGSVQQSKGH